MAAIQPVDVARTNAPVDRAGHASGQGMSPVGHPAQRLADTRTCGRGDGYARRRPEETALYQAIAEHWPGFRERIEHAGGLPKFIAREFEEYLKCGILEHGCLHLVCRSCGYSEVVAFSCKKRGFCPSCLGRRMVDTAVHLEERVLPTVPIRHWICSLPWGLRALAGYDRRLCALVASAFVGELSRSVKRRAKKELRLPSVADAHPGAVAAVQRTDGALRLNVHLHVLALDGVYVRDQRSGALRFHALLTPTRADIEEVARRTAAGIEKLLRATGRTFEPEADDGPPSELALDEPGLAACYAAAAQGVSVSGDRAGLPTLRLVFPHEPPPRGADTGPLADAPVAEVRGINVHAKQVVDGRDRRQLEWLCRYIMRPPVAQERLERLADGRLELRLKHAWKDGTRAILLEPDDLVVRLVAAVPPPHFHLLRYFGVLSSHSRLRKHVVPRPPHDPSATVPPPAPGDQLELRSKPRATSRRPGASVGPGCSGTCLQPIWILAPATRDPCAGCRLPPPRKRHATCLRGSGSRLALRPLRPRSGS